MMTDEREPYGVGIVGYGFMGMTHTYAYRTIPFYYPHLPIPYVMKGVCVRRPETLEIAMNAGEFELGTTEYEELLDSDDVHIIHICTPNVLHAEQIVEAIKAGKHVYCDKPLTASYEECKPVLEAMETYGKNLVTQVALQYRFYPCTMRAKQLLEEGFPGRILSFRACYLHASSVDPEKPLTWKLDKSKGGGGVLYDLGSHVLDLVNWLIGPFTAVSAATHTAYRERLHPESGERVPVAGEDLVIMNLRTHEGALGSVEASKIATGSNDELRVEIHGELGAIRFDLMNPSWLEVYDIRDPGDPIGGMRGFKRIETVGRYPAPAGKFPAPALNPGWLRAHVACLHNFLYAIGGKGKAAPAFHEAAELQRVMDTAYRSAESGAWETL